MDISLRARFIYPFNPFKLNQRISVQQGGFLCPGDINVRFYENLQAMDDWEDDNNVFEIHLTGNCLVKGLEALTRMNITRESIYPGLDGFASSYKTRIYILPRLTGE